jgi:hypothetical protein
MICAFVVSWTLKSYYHLDTDRPVDFAHTMLITVGITTVVWLATTYLTKPEPQDVLVAFYRRTRPSLSGWRSIARLAPEVKPNRDGLSNLLDWISGCVLIYGVLFGVGKLLLHETVVGLGLLVLGLAGGAVIYWDLNRRGWSTVVE